MSLLDDIVEDTANALRGEFRVEGMLSKIIATRLVFGPWTLSYVEYGDGNLTCGIANNECKFPTDSKFFKDFLGRDVYTVLEELENYHDPFSNSIRLSILSALTVRILDKISTSYDLEQVNLYEAFLSTVRNFVRSSDHVVLVGYHNILAHHCAEICEKVSVTELRNLEEYEVLDSEEESKIEVYPASMKKRILSRSDVIFITGETLANETSGEILELSRGAKCRIIYGPTSSFYPKALFERGIDCSIFITFPPSPDFLRFFRNSRGSWYTRPDVKSLIIRTR